MNSPKSCKNVENLPIWWKTYGKNKLQMLE